MKTLKSILLFVIATFEIATAQVDTTDWFPMQTGNYWEYMAWTGEGPKYFSVKVIGDTLMPNGKTYKSYFYNYFDSTFEDTRYFRKDSTKVFEYFGFPIYCPESEYLYLDFFVPDSTIWEICRPIDDNARGISKTFYDYTYYSFLQKPNLAKQFEHVYIDSADTIWTPSEGSIPIVINKGIGIVWHFIFNDGSYYLQGAIINGIQMGTIVDVEKEDNLVPNNFSLRSYPNPFNSSTTLEINLPVTGLTELSIYNILGQKVATILDEYKTAGSYNVQFNANNLSSGVYLAVLKQNKFILKEKTILLK